MKTIDDVILRLEQIVAHCKQQQSSMGYFAALYLTMTRAVKTGIAAGAFADAGRMERLDVLFAMRYIDAFEKYTQQHKTTRAWTAAFEACQNEKLTVLQHLLLGINAHINLDLGIAAAATAPNEAIYDLKADFMLINTVIADLTEKTQDKLAEIWWAMSLFDALLKSSDEGVANFSIKLARSFSWKSALSLAFSPEQMYQNNLNNIDRAVALIAKKIQNPGYLAQAGLWCMRKAETGSVADKIDILLKA